MPVKLTTEQFIQKSKDIHGNLYEYTDVDYSNIHTKVKIKCKSHGVFEQKPNLHLSGNGCPSCGRERTTKYKSENVESWMEKKNKTMLERHGTEHALRVEKFKAAAISTNLANHGGLHYSQQMDVKSNNSKRAMMDQFGMSQETIDKLNNVEYLSGLNKTMSLDEIADLIGVGWDSIQNAFKRLCITPQRHHKVSKGENELRQMIQDLGVVADTSVYGIIGDKELDIFIKDKSLAIEFNGLYWHSEEAGRDSKYHQTKLMLCNRSNIRLVQIWEDSMDEENKQRTFKFIKNLLGFNKTKLNARNGVVKSISQQMFFDFAESNHMQGGCSNLTERLGLFIDGELVSVMGFRKVVNSDLYNLDNGFELARFSTIGVRGAFSKLEKHFIRNNNPNFILSFADLETVDPNKNVYLSNGYSLHHKIEPDYKYVGKLTNWKRDHKFKWRKPKFISLGFDLDGKTEDMLRKEAKLHKVWDSGKIAYIKYHK